MDLGGVSAHQAQHRTLFARRPIFGSYSASKRQRLSCRNAASKDSTSSSDTELNVRATSSNLNGNGQSNDSGKDLNFNVRDTSSNASADLNGNVGSSNLNGSVGSSSSSPSSGSNGSVGNASLNGNVGKELELNERILSGEFTAEGSTREKLIRPLRRLLAKNKWGPGRWLSKWLADRARQWSREAALRMPEARGDIREIVGQPVFVPLYKLYLVYGGVFRLSFGPKTFVIVSDREVAKQILVTNAAQYSKGILSEILDFVMGQGLIPANGEIWKTRRRAVVPSLHKKYLASMVNLFGESNLHGITQLEQAAKMGKPMEMENFFSRLTLDIIGKAVFNYDFDSLTNDDPVIQAVYTALREAEHRSTAPLAYWNLPGASTIVPRQRRCQEAMKVINGTLDSLIAKCQRLVDTEDKEFEEEFLSQEDPSMLHFLLASGEEVSSQQLRDDLMTLLIAGHETTAAVLTWTVFSLTEHPEVVTRLQQEADEVIGDKKPTMEDLKSLKFTTRVINEAMRLYPQPPVLIRRALEPDVLGGYPIKPNTDIFISVWNLHRSKKYWPDADKFDPDRFPIDKPVPNESTHNYAYLPFGGGRRKCIGDQFALFEAVCSLAMLMRRFEFKLSKNAPPVNMTTGATIHTSEGLLTDIILRHDNISNNNGNGEQSLKCLGDTLAKTTGTDGKLQDAQTWASASNGASSNEEEKNNGSTKKSEVEALR